MHGELRFRAVDFVIYQIVRQIIESFLSRSIMALTSSAHRVNQIEGGWRFMFLTL